MKYSPGLHILVEFKTEAVALLKDCAAFKKLMEQMIVQHHLVKVGDVFHSFDNAGFTAVVCLTESHVSIHTWPEFGSATFDVFLSNFEKDNDEKTRKIAQLVLEYFESKEVVQTELRR